MKYITRVQTVQERLRVNKDNASFEIAALFHRLCGDGKSAVISKLALSLSTLSRSLHSGQLIKGGGDKTTSDR